MEKVEQKEIKDLKQQETKALTKHWYAIYTNPRAEKQVFQRLQDKGIDAYLPLQKKIRQWSDRKKVIEMPLLSSYCFVHIDRHDYDEVLKTHGVVKYITFEGKAAAIPNNQIDNLRIIIDSNADVETTWKTFNKGEKVRVNGGALKGLEGVLISDGERRKVLVRIERIDQNLIVEVPRGLLELVK